MRSRLIFGSLLALIVIGGVANAQSNGTAVLLPGLWEITVQTRSPIVGPPLTHTVCIDKALLTRPEPPKAKASDDCQVQPDTAAVNETAYTIRCTKQNVTSSVRFTYRGDHFDGTATITKADGEIRQVYSAKRVGECDEVRDLAATSTAH
jgi:hypothetical protein